MILTQLLVFTLIITAGSLFISDAFAQIGPGGSPFQREFVDVKFLDAYFGVGDEKIEVSPGDQNVPFTIVVANIATQDLTGIRGQLSLPLGFSSANGIGSLIIADAQSSSTAGEVFTLTFFVNIGDQVRIGQYSATAKVDYGRLRESGIRDSFFEFNFKVTGDSIINMRAVDHFLTSLKNNHIVIEISNDGTAPVSGVDKTLRVQFPQRHNLLLM
jgi:hypothetical protein